MDLAFSGHSGPGNETFWILLALAYLQKDPDDFFFYHLYISSDNICWTGPYPERWASPANSDTCLMFIMFGTPAFICFYHVYESAWNGRAQDVDWVSLLDFIGMLTFSAWKTSLSLRDEHNIRFFRRSSPNMVEVDTPSVEKVVDYPHYPRKIP